MVVYYRFAGLVAVVGLVVNIILLFGIMSMFNFVLTLPGIAGIILTIGLAVDANVLIYERLREEMTAGKSLAGAVESAYNKAFSVIFDANATTLITAAILFWQASGPIKGFAVTLTVGIIASVFSAMVVTRTLFGWALQFGWIKRITMLHLINPEKQIDFMGRRRLWISISLAVILISMAGFALRGSRNFGVDFLGGDLLTLQPAQEVTVAQVRDALDLPAVRKSLVITKEVRGGQDGAAFHHHPQPEGYDRARSGYAAEEPAAGGLHHGRRTTRWAAWWAGNWRALRSGPSAWPCVGILLYVTIRFELSFAIGAWWRCCTMCSSPWACSPSAAMSFPSSWWARS